MTQTAPVSLPAMFFAQAARRAGQPFLYAKRGGEWINWRWDIVAEQVRRLASALIGHGLEVGERVAILAENRPEWLISDLAVLAAGGVTVPVYTTNTEDDHRYVLAHAEARMVIVSTAALAARLWPALGDVPSVRLVIGLETFNAPAGGPPLAAWQGLIEHGRADDPAVTQRIAVQTRADIAAIIYTSGTGGRPKGVLHSHGNILHNCAGAGAVLAVLPPAPVERFLSFLPLSHAYEHTAGQFFPIWLGAEIAYAEGADALAGNLVEMKPTLLVSVPRLYEVLQRRILAALEHQPAKARTAFLRTLDIGIRRIEGERIGLLDWLYDAVIGRRVRARVAARFGGRLKAMVSGGAALNYEAGRFFLALGQLIAQGYGQTETGPVSAVNVPGRIDLRSVGPALPETEIRIAPDGEILVRGELVTPGYWRDAAGTAALIRDGWLYSGDIGRLDESGRLYITDRKRDMIVLSGGDNVSPAKVEGILTLEPEIGQALVHGDGRPHLVAVLVPHEAFLQRFAAARGLTPDLTALAGNDDLRAALAEALARANSRLSQIERVRAFLIAPAPFALDNQQLTPTLKLRRHAIRAAYGPALDGLYAGKGR